MVGALTDGCFRFRSFLRCSDNPVDCRSVLRIEAAPSPFDGCGEVLLVARDPLDFIDRRHCGRATGAPSLAACQSLENVTFVSGPRAVAVRGRVALWVDAST
jgi:hypothetical protein